MSIRLPVCPDIERFILGSVVLNQRLLDDVRADVEADAFSEERHKRIWRAVCKLFDAGSEVDRVTVYSALKAAGEAEACGGLGYLVGLDEGLPASPSITSYVERLKDAALRRRVILSAQKLALLAADEGAETSQVLDTMAGMAAKLQDEGSRREEMVSTASLLAAEGPDSILSPRTTGKGIPLPWPALGDALAGFQEGQLIVLTGATSRGKTSFALQAAAHAAIHGFAPLDWTMEMSPRSLFRRMVSQVSGSALAYRAGQLSFQERDSQREALATLDEHPVHFDNRSRTVSHFARHCRKVRAKFGIVDYLQLIRGDSRAGSRAQEVSGNSRALKLAATDLGIPILVICQVDRGSVKGKDADIGLHSGKESGDIENDADVMLAIKAEPFTRDTPSLAPVWVLKQREGPTGFSIPMVFNPTTQSFRETA